MCTDYITHPCVILLLAQARPKMPCVNMHRSQCISDIRAGGNGTACMAIAVPVFEEEKWRRLDSNLNLRYRMSSPSAPP